MSVLDLRLVIAGHHSNHWRMFLSSPMDEVLGPRFFKGPEGFTATVPSCKTGVLHRKSLVFNIPANRVAIEEVCSFWR